MTYQEHKALLRGFLRTRIRDFLIKHFPEETKEAGYIAGYAEGYADGYFTSLKEKIHD